MSLRLGIDMDGTLADLSSAYRQVEHTLFGDRPPKAANASNDLEIEEGEQEEAAAEGKRALKAARHEARQRDLIWATIRSTEDFWLGLRPLEPGVVRRLFDVSMANDWEVFFITQRPRTAGQNVQRQTQQWLLREGFEVPSVLTLSGGRGRAAAALELDVLVDDFPKNCVDVISSSRCRPILVLRNEEAHSEAAARKLGIGVIRSVAEAITQLETPGAPPATRLIDRIVRKFTLKSVD